MKKRALKHNKSVNLNNKYIVNLCVRYFFLIIVVLSLPLFYRILTPLTVKSVSFLLNLVYQGVYSNKNFIYLGKTLIELIPACVAGSAYILLLILNLTVEMSLKKRFFSIIISFLLLFSLNVTRIFLLAILYHNQNPYFDFTHKLFWYFLSTIFVIGIWFLTVKVFSIKEIPAYSDVKLLIKGMKSRK